MFGNTERNRREFERQTKRISLIASAIIVFLLLCLGVLLYALNGSVNRQAHAAKATIALVNEDKPESFNGAPYNFGQSFVKLVSNDDTYNWQVEPRSVADKAYKDGSVGAVIYLPQDFSHNILTLQAVNPQKAEVDYKVLPSQSELNNQLLRGKITKVLYDFNASVVKMYYASVASNVANAQTSMGTVVSTQDKLISDLKKNVYPPSQEANQSYESVVAMANGLKSQNDGWIQSQNGFTTATVNMLNSQSSAFSSQLPGMTDYFNTQQAIANANLANANKGIADQAKVDATFYKTQFDAAHDSTLQSLAGFCAPNSNAGSDAGAASCSRDSASNTAYADLRSKVDDYNTKISTVSGELGNKADTLTSNRQNLLELEQRLYSQFFAQNDVLSNASDPAALQRQQADLKNGQTTDNARKALALMLTKSFSMKDNITSTAYPTKIAELLGNVSVNPDDYNAVFDALAKNGSLNDRQIQQYKDELKVLGNYAAAFSDTVKPGSVRFDPVPAQDAAHQTLEKTLTITVPKATSDTLTFAATDGLSNSDVVPHVSMVSAVGAPAKTITPGSDGSWLLDNRFAPEASGGDGKDPAAPAPTTKSASYVITYDVDMSQSNGGKVTFQWGETASDTSNAGSHGNADSKDCSQSGSKDGAAADGRNSSRDGSNTGSGSGSKDDAAQGGETQPMQSSTDVFALVPPNAASDYAGGAQFGYLTTVLGDIDTASSLIAFLYGAPGASYAELTDATTRQDFENDSAQSIFSRYGNMSIDEVAPRLSDQDVEQFQSLGAGNIDKVVATLNAVDDAISGFRNEQNALNGDNGANLPNTYFTDTMGNLSSWYTTAMGTLDKQYQSWTDTKANPLPEKPWNQRSSDDSALYSNAQGDSSLYSTITQLVTSSAQQAKETASNAQIIKDNGDGFKQMVGMVTQTQSSAKKALDNTSGILDNGDKDLKKSKDYYGNFQSVLANTRTNGVNADTIFSFFSKPLDTKDISPTASVAKTFDWRWIVVLAIGILIGVLGKTWIRRKPKDEDLR